MNEGNERQGGALERILFGKMDASTGTLWMLAYILLFTVVGGLVAYGFL